MTVLENQLTENFISEGYEYTLEIVLSFLLKASSLIEINQARELNIKSADNNFQIAFEDLRVSEVLYESTRGSVLIKLDGFKTKKLH